MAIQVFVSAFRVEECLSEIGQCLEKVWTLEFEEAGKTYTGPPQPSCPGFDRDSYARTDTKEPFGRYPFVQLAGCELISLPLDLNLTHDDAHIVASLVRGGRN